MEFGVIYKLQYIYIHINILFSQIQTCKNEKKQHHTFFFFNRLNFNTRYIYPCSNIKTYQTGCILQASVVSLQCAEQKLELERFCPSYRLARKLSQFKFIPRACCKAHANFPTFQFQDLCNSIHRLHHLFLEKR